MGTILEPPFDLPDTDLPDHLQLPDSDGKPVENFQEHPQSILLTGAIWPVLERRHPDGRFAVGQNSGIYWWSTSPPLRGCKAPDWYYVPDVPPTLDGVPRRSYVLWKEIRSPLIVLEFVSGDGSEERDRTPMEGKFWVYEQGIRVPYYGIYEADPGRVELYELVHGRYAPVAANARGHLEVPPLGLALGLWTGTYHNFTLPWLRWYDLHGDLLPSAEERAEQEQRRAEQERQRAEEALATVSEQQRDIERLQARLRELEGRAE